MKYLAILTTGIILYLGTSSCCNEDDVHYRLPSHYGRYYEENDTIVFFSEETDEYESFVVCDRYEIMRSDEIKGTWCSWMEYFEKKQFEINRESCNSARHFVIIYEKLSSGSNSHFWSYYEHEDRDWSTTIRDTAHYHTVELLGYTYDEVAMGSTSPGDSLKSYMFSKEYGLIQYSFEHTAFSLIQNEKVTNQSLPI